MISRRRPFFGGAAGMSDLGRELHVRLLVSDILESPGRQRKFRIVPFSTGWLLAALTESPSGGGFKGHRQDRLAAAELFQAFTGDLAVNFAADPLHHPWPAASLMSARKMACTRALRVFASCGMVRLAIGAAKLISKP